jgi:nucleoside-diphosphate-sugar epimerase
MKILLLGAAGFIGSHLTARLLEERHTVVGVDVKNDKVSELLKARSPQGGIAFGFF